MLDIPTVVNLINKAAEHIPAERLWLRLKNTSLGRSKTDIRSHGNRQQSFTL